MPNGHPLQFGYSKFDYVGTTIGRPLISEQMSWLLTHRRMPNRHPCDQSFYSVKFFGLFEFTPYTPPAMPETASRRSFPMPAV